MDEFVGNAHNQVKVNGTSVPQINLVAGSGVTLTPSGSNVTIAASGAGGGGVPSFSGFFANNSSPNASTPFIWDTVDEDTDSMYNPVTGLFSIPGLAKPGRYLFTVLNRANTAFGNLFVGDGSATILKYLASPQASPQALSMSTVLNFSANATVGIYCNVNLNLTGNTPGVNALTINRL